jgi:hypothetical protein
VTELATHYRTVKVDGLDVFYREAGPKNAPPILLLHGFPTSSHCFGITVNAHLKCALRRPNYSNCRTPNVELHVIDAGHFALETQGPVIATYIRGFLVQKRTAKPASTSP